ncbi:secreted arabinase [Coprinopsis sp. MPI-PUGE-AT-0042]|nr:secreted arabinase [Coprinopsis sp. MPI-PUGE-AT-0042]
MFTLKTFSLWALASTLLTTVVGQANPDPLTGDIKGVHDPTICKDKNGRWYLFSTGPGIAIRTSTDGKHWVEAGQVFPNGRANWTDPYTGRQNGDLWAPDCYYSGSEFLLYYSASTISSRKSAIFLAKSTSGSSGTWSNLGLVTSTTNASNYNAIDPNLVIDNGRWYMSSGSYWSGIKLVTVDPNTGKPSSDTLLSIASRTENGRAIEASSIYKYGDYWYHFVSWDKSCCGTGATYNIRVGRSSKVTGPYVGRDNKAMTNGGGTLVLSAHGNIWGTGGQDVFTDKDGPVLVYHYFNSDGRMFGINKLSFESGWPVVV